MTATDKSQPQTINIESLTFDRGAHLLIKKALAETPIGSRLGVCGTGADVPVHLLAWCRMHGHEFEVGPIATDSVSNLIGWITRGSAIDGRMRDAHETGLVDPRLPGAVVDRPSQSWGLAARGARVERGGPEFSFLLAQKDDVWSENAAKLYAQAAASQWDPATAIQWNEPFDIPIEVERAVVQVMTYLIENENAALLVPAKFLGQIHPHFKEVIQFLALQVADEARHIEVFTRRATLKICQLGLSTVSGQASLKTLLDEPDFSLASFLLSVLGEGTFLNLLLFLETHAPDPVTRQVAKLTARDEARHVAFGLGHLQYQLSVEPLLRDRLAAAINKRHDALANTAGLNEEVFDALVLLAAGAWTPSAIARGYEAVQILQRDMQNDRTSRLLKLGFAPDEANKLASLHTRNFM